MDLFSNLINQNNNEIAIIDNFNNYSYKQLNSDLKKFDNFFPKRSIILFFGKNTYDSLLFYIHCIIHKNVPILLDPLTDSKYIIDIINRYKPHFIYLPSESNFKNSHYNYQGKIMNYLILKIKKHIDYKIFKNLALLLSTSGSTGSPKLVRISYYNLFSNTQSIIEYLKIKNDHRTITTLPFNYSYGLSIINTHIEVGASIVMNEFSMIQKNFWEQFNSNQITSFGGVPYNYEILKNIKFENFSLENFKYSTVAGGNLDLITLEYFLNIYKSLNKKLFVMYGQTEASPRISYLPWEKLEFKKGSIGIPIPAGKLYIKNNSKNNSDKNLVGELIYEGPNVCLGYAHNFNDLSLGDKNNGILYTGDIAKRDKEDFFYIIGRTKRIAKIFGMRISLDEIEEQLKNNAISAACIEKENCIFIYFTKTSDIKIAKQIITKKMKINPKLIRIQLLKKIPLTHNGKYDYLEIERKY